MRTLLIILFSLFQTFAFSQSMSWWYGNGSSAAPAGPDTLTLTYWDDFILLHIANTGITETGSGVSEWQDRSGNGNHSTQTVDTNRPTVDGSGNVVFDGVDNFLDMTNIWATTTDTAFTVFVVAEMVSIGSAEVDRFVEFSETERFLNLTVRDDGSSTVNLRSAIFDNSGLIVLDSDTFSISTPILFTSAASQATTFDIRRNGAQKRTTSVSSPAFQNSGSPTNTSAVGSNAVASLGFINAKIKFIGISDKKFTPAEIATTESELNSFFTIY